MTDYVIFFQDFAGRVFSTANFEAANDETAIAKARRIYYSGIGQGYEIHCQGRHVHSEPIKTPNFG